MNAPRCSNCGTVATLVTGAKIYPHRQDLYKKRFWLCVECGAYCGCHPGSTKPLGTPADAETRKARSAAHFAFDVIWRSGRIPRWEAYAWLAQQLELPTHLCHIGMFDVDTCRRVIELSRANYDAILSWAATKKFRDSIKKAP